mgnify:CR=1 FL=1
MRVIDFSHPEWRALAQQLLDESPQVIRGRQWQPLIGMLRDNQLLLPLGNHRYELTPAGRRYLTRELMLAEIAVAFALPAIFGAFACAVVTGIVFGFMPARKAARLDPVKALTSE